MIRGNSDAILARHGNHGGAIVFQNRHYVKRENGKRSKQIATIIIERRDLCGGVLTNAVEK
jgi:hypothetical protein